MTKVRTVTARGRNARLLHVEHLWKTSLLKAILRKFGSTSARVSARLFWSKSVGVRHNVKFAGRPGVQHPSSRISTVQDPQSQGATSVFIVASTEYSCFPSISHNHAVMSGLVISLHL